MAAGEATQNGRPQDGRRLTKWPPRAPNAPRGPSCAQSREAPRDLTSENRWSGADRRKAPREAGLPAPSPKGGQRGAVAPQPVLSLRLCSGHGDPPLGLSWLRRGCEPPLLPRPRRARERLRLHRRAHPWQPPARGSALVGKPPIDPPRTRPPGSGGLGRTPPMPPGRNASSAGPTPQL